MPDVKLPHFQFYPGDFLTDTMAMPVETRGIYITLLCYQWMNGSIPADDRVVARICSISPDELAAHMPYLDDKFVENAEQKGTRVNRRMERERQKAQRFRASRAAAGRKSGEQRRNKARTKPPTKSNLSLSLSSSEKDDSPAGSSREHPFGDVLEEADKKNSVNCPITKIVELYHELCPQLPRVKVMSDKRKKVLRTRWREDKKRQNLEWWIKYFEYIARQPFLNGENDRQWTADIDFVIRQSGLIQIIEGKYER